VLLAASFTAGIVWADLGGGRGAWPVVAALAAAAFALSFRQRLASARPAAACGLVLAAGAARYDATAADARAPPVVAVGEPVRLRGRLLEIAAGAGARGAPRAFLLEADAVETRAGFRPVRERLRGALVGAGPAPGPFDRVEVVGTLRPLSPAGNPGEWDAARARAREGVRWALSVEGPDAFRVRERAGLRGTPGRRRAALAAWADARLPPRAAGLFRALILGDRGGLDEELGEAMLRSGTVHFLSISGVHVSLVVAFVVGLGRRLGLGLEARALTAAPFALGYCLLSGAPATALRATVAGAAALLAFPLRGRAEGWNSWLLSWLVVVALEPAAPFSTGCQLSFAAVAGILAFGRDPDPAMAASGRGGVEGPATPARGALRRLAAAARGSLVLTLAASAATAPLVLAAFHLVTPVAVAANLVIAPLIAVALVLGLLIGALAALAVPDAVLQAPALAFTWTTDATGFLARHLAAVPWGHFHLPAPPAGALALYAFVLAAAAFTRRRALLLPLPVLLAAPLLLPAPVPAGLRLDALDVGHGLSVLVRAGRDSFLYDAGSRDRPEVGPRVIAPALWALGVRRLDRLLLSHGDFDHVGAAAAVARRFRPREVWASASARPFAPAPAREAGRGDGWEGERGVRVAVLGPPAPGAPLPGNDASLVVLVRSPWGGALLTGDIEEAGIACLLRSAPDLAVDVLLLPHHGDWSDGLDRLLERVRPRLVLVSGRAAFASPRTAALLGREGAEVLRTDEDGALRVELGPGGIEAAGWRSARRVRLPPR
jgi:competence protein ComEC